MRFRSFAAFLCAVLVCAAVPVAAAEWKFERPIEIMVPAGAGGGLDVTLRSFAPLLEKELGVSVIIDNRTGGSGATGYTFSYTQPRDGYTFQFTAPSFIGPASQGQFPVPVWDELVPVCGLVQAEAMIFANKDAPFKNVTELIEYVRANPGKVACALDTPTGISGACLGSFARAAGGLQFRAVASEEAETLTSMIAGDVQISVNTWTDAGSYVEAGDAVAICTLTEAQSTIVPNIPSSASAGAPVSLGYYRVFTTLKGTPQEAIDAFVAGVMRASETPEWQKILETNGLNNDYRWNAEELRAVLDETYTVFTELFKAE